MGIKIVDLNVTIKNFIKINVAIKIIINTRYFDFLHVVAILGNISNLINLLIYFLLFFLL